MYTLLIVLISLLAILLCVIILVQAGKGGGLASTFGGASSSTESFMGGRQTATVLTKATWAGGALFLFLGLVLAVLSSRQGTTGESILREGMGPTQQVPQSPTSVLESEDGDADAGAPPLEPGGAAGGTEPGAGQGGSGGEGPGPDASGGGSS